MRGKAVPPWLVVALVCVPLPALAGWALLRGSESCCGQQGRFDLPGLQLPKPEPPAACADAMARARAMEEELRAEIPASLQTAVQQAVADREPDETEPEAWDAAATLALLDKQPAVALWAELQALRLEWNPHYAAQAGVFLAMLEGRADDARLFLHCAYGAGNRSPFLLEALSALARRAGNREQAAAYIDEASLEAPLDEAIRIQKVLLRTGRPPTPQRPLDAVDAALARFARHTEWAVTVLRASERLRARVEETYFGEQPSGGGDAFIDAAREGYAQMLASLAEPARLAKRTPEQLAAEYPGAPAAALRTQFRNLFFSTIAGMYLSVTEQVVTRRPATIAEGFDVEFWAEPMGLDPVQYARMIRARRDFAVGDVALVCGGYTWEDWGGAAFRTLFTVAGDRRREGRDGCARTHRGDLAAEEACKLEVDKRYCATVRQLHAEWANVTEALHLRLASRFDRAAAAVLMRAGNEVADAYAFASNVAKEMNVKPGAVQGPAWLQEANRQGQESLKALNEQYRRLVDMSVRNGSGGPAARLDREARTFQIYRDNAGTALESYKSRIEETCEPVDRKVLEQLVGEHRKAVSEMLWDKLVKDLNAEWDPNASCTLGVGKWFQASIDIEGKKSFGGKWALGKRAFSQGESLEIGRNYKSNWSKEGDFNGVSVTVEGAGKAGGATGKAGITAGVQWNEKSGGWDFPVEVSGTVGLGYKSKNEIGFT